MIKEYRGTSTIKIMAEQFTGKNEQVKRYRLFHRGFIENGESWVIATPEGHMPVHYGDWITIGVNGEHSVFSDEIFKKTYEETPGQPQSDFEQLVADLKLRVKHVAGSNIRIKANTSERGQREVLVCWPNGEYIAKCNAYINGPTDVTVEMFKQMPMLPFLVRIMSDAIIALSDFADKWKKLEEQKNGNVYENV